MTRKQALDRVLEIGTAYLGIEHGHVVDIDSAADRWEAVGSTDPPEGPYPEGLVADLETTYCRRTLGRESPLALHDAPGQGWADEAAYRTHGLNTYLGIRIDVFEQPYGTLCFVDEESREEPFSEAERIFMELAGQVLGQVLEGTQREREIANRDRVIAILNRVLRHNLRNDLNVVGGYAELLERRLEGDDAAMAVSIRTTANRLVGLAEKARRLEQLTGGVPVGRPTNIVPMVEAAIERTRERHPSAELTWAGPDEALTLAAPALEEALVELLENAAIHGGRRTDIVVEANRKEGRVSVRVVDDGPGLPADERRVLTHGDETPLEHGSGLGLFLVFWILHHLDGEIDVTASEAGTTVELRLDRPA